MQPRYAYYFAHQHGLILRRQVLGSGMTDKELASLVRAGHWVVVRRCVRTTRTHWDSLDPYVGRPRLQVWAAIMLMQTPHIISHDSAAYLHSLPILEAEPRL